ncbi:Uu.00g095000.m01.CDS01 [Anthostomella pinea]|uniref:Uu.00g095000.m01.CDS01 n=1 Tax=Anthostomella pinea TaxID=933095 RepID=A0AAI8VNT7_9PEZI|nr:Uu.00g095000.m01.CDS01 [Anthostomella pinea]
MGADLVEFSAFKESLEEANIYFRSLGCTWSVLDELSATPLSSRIDDPRLAQPLCTALQVAHVDLLTAWGVSSQAVVGHSSGEIAAAYCTGALTRESAWLVAYFRGEAVTKLAVHPQNSKGAMLAVGLSEVELEPHIAAVVAEGEASNLTCACINSYQSTTVAGVESYIDKLASRLRSNKIFARKLNVPVAYHSPQMLQVADAYKAMLEGYLATRPQSACSPRPLFFSSVLGSELSDEDLCQASYWVSNLVSKVRFSEAVKLMVSSLSEPKPAVLPYLIEVGPHPTLQRPVKEILGDDADYMYDHIVQRNQSSGRTAMEMLGKLVIHGYPVNVEAANNYASSGYEPKMLLNLPRYPFNHTQSYSLESRLSRNRRFRKSPRHELLGNPTTDWNPYEPKWRFTIRESDLPWVVDHKIDGTVLYPAAGMLAMVLEGARALTTGDTTVVGYRLRDVSVTSALVVPITDDGIETQLHMHPHSRLPADRSAPAWAFAIYSVMDNNWELHISSQAFTVQRATTDLVSGGILDGCAQPAHANGFSEASGRCTDRIDSAQFYSDIHKKGFHFGKTFQTLDDISVNHRDREATARVTFGQWTQLVRQHELRDHIIHPSTLDSLLHVLFASTRQSWHVWPTMVPTRFSDVYISCGLLEGLREDAMLLHGKIISRGISHMDGDVVAVDSVTKAPMIIARGCRLSAFHASNQQEGMLPKLATLFHQLHWKPDISLMSQCQIEEYCCREPRGLPGHEIDRRTETVCRHFMSTALEALLDTFLPSKPELQNYTQWATGFLEREKQATSDLIQDWSGFDQDGMGSNLIDDYRASSSANNSLVLFLSNLPAILAGEVDPLHLMFNDGVAESFYERPIFSLSAYRIALYMDLLAHKNSNIHIIEVGAGTGSATNAVLDVLSRQGRFTGSSPRFNKYDFTDISPSLFAKVQERYAGYSSGMRYKTLDIGRDPTEQGFEPNSYDVVIAASVLHATENIETTLENVKKLLRPGGQLIFAEPTNHRIATIPCFSGVLPGWWLSTDEFRTSGPLLSKQDWNRALLHAGFEGLRVSLSDDVEENHVLTVMVSCLPSSANHKNDPTTVIIAETGEQREIANTLQAELASRTESACDIHSLDSYVSVPDKYEQCISLIEIWNPVLDRMTEVQFQALQQILRASKQIIWVNDSCGEVPSKPESSMISGFGETIMRENPDTSFIHLNLDPGPSVATDILRIVQHRRSVHTRQMETDLLKQSDVFLIPRVVEAPHINKLLEYESGGTLPKATAVDKEWESADNALELHHIPKGLDSFHYAFDPRPLQALHESEVRVLVKATGINFKDVMVALNQVADDHIGQEFAGVVTQIGSSSETTFRPGDKVCGFTDGSFRTFVRAKNSHLMKVPESMPFGEASAIPIAYATAHGGSGQAAVQIAQSVGATVYVTVSTPEKKKLLMGRYHIHSDQFFSSRHLAFAQQIMQRTDGRGVDVVLNSLSGQALTETWRCLAAFGRFIELGKRDIAAFKDLPMEPFQRNVSFCSLDLAVVSKHNDALMRKIMREVQSLVLDESTRKYSAAYPLTVFKRSGFEDAFRLLQTGQHSGKAVVDWEQDDILQVIPKRELDYEFDSNATYFITGGLGGVGRSIAAWMSRHGAKHLVLLSRSGVKTPAAVELVTSLENSGVCVYTPRCDITDADALKAVVQHVQASMPPIRGCIQGSMVIKNSMFQDFTLREFQASIDPKVKGTWNLHHQLPPQMDFFVLLSSIAGVHGASSQANYAAANAFLDAFARFRHAQGQRCISLDLGIIENIGYIAERIDVVQGFAMSYLDYKSLREQDLHFMLKYACNPRLSVSSPWETQLLGALTTPASVKRGGFIQDHGWMRLPMFCHLYQMEQDVESPSAAIQPDSSGFQLRAAESLDEAAAVVAALLARRLALSLAVPVEDIDINCPPHTYGVDSLLAVELVHWFSTEIRSDMPTVQILGSTTTAQLGLLAAAKSDHVLNRD